jgi:hypothetical protein
MSNNIHRISDFENNNAGGNNRQNVPLLGGNLSYQNPRKEPFCIFLKNFCCPLSTIKSVMFVVSMIDIIMYIITISFGVEKSYPDSPSLLAPRGDILDKFGELV